MSSILLTDLPTITDQEAVDKGIVSAPDDILLLRSVNQRCTYRLTVDILLKTIPIGVLLEHILRRLDARNK